VAQSYNDLFQNCPKAISLHQRLINLNLKLHDRVRSNAIIEADIAKLTNELASDKKVQLYMRRALLHVEKEDFKSALKDIDTALEQVPTNQHFLLLSTLLNLKLDNNKAALKALDTLLESNPRYEEALMLKALMANR
ncbi:MAG: tetratricopeptide repeat protein, partial [Bacteroidota bacterium]